MKHTGPVNHNTRKFLFPFLAVFLIILLFKNGYQFGQWLCTIFK